MVYKTFPPRRGLARSEVVVLCALAVTFLPLFISCGSRPTDAGSGDKDTRQAALDLRAAQQFAECKNRLKTLMLAVQNYHDTYRKLPPLRLTPAPGLSSMNASWHYGLLPFVEQDTAFKKGAAQPHAPWEAPMPDGSLVRAQAIAYFLCPADESVDFGFPANRKSGKAEWAATTYAANATLFGAATQQGCHIARYKLGTVPDGTSNTIGVAEIYGGGKNDEASLWAWSDYTQKQYYAAFAMKDYGSWKEPPQFRVPTAQYDHARAGTWHKVCMVGLLDGSVREIGPKIAPKVWEQACTPDDGAKLQPDWGS